MTCLHAPLTQRHSSPHVTSFFPRLSLPLALLPAPRPRPPPCSGHRPRLPRSCASQAKHEILIERDVDKKRKARKVAAEAAKVRGTASTTENLMRGGALACPAFSPTRWHFLIHVLLRGILIYVLLRGGARASPASDAWA
jgi:hypothetical protein